MKKIVTLIILFVASISLTQANIRLIDLNGNDVTNSAFSDVVDTSSLDPYEYDLDVINNSSSTINIACSRTQNAIVSGSESYFCWDVCYTPTVNTALTPLTVNAFDTLSGYFHSYFRTNYTVGGSVLRYKFTNTVDANDTAEIFIYLYAGTLGVKNLGISASNKIGVAYPNPAAGATSIRYAVENASNTQFELSNALGQVVYSKQLESNKGTVQLATSAFTPGVYYYTLRVDGARIASKKLVITQ